MVTHTLHMTVEEFDRYVELPEHADRLFEYIGGEVVEVVSNNYLSEIAANILAEIRMFIKGKGLGRVTGADGGYVVSGERYIPDAAFISKEKQPEPSRDAYNPIPPDLAVEVLSPSNDPALMRIEVVNYWRAGTMVWVVDPEKSQVEVYTPDQPPKTVGIDGVLDGGDVLPGFVLAVKAIFPEECRDAALAHRPSDSNRTPDRFPHRCAGRTGARWHSRRTRRRGGDRLVGQ